jgi:hypothetical protein
MDNPEQKARELLAKSPIPDRHSLFQLKHFVVGKEPTEAGRSWQCLEEIRSRLESLDTIKFRVEDVKDKIVLRRIRLDCLKNSPESPEQVVRVRMTVRSIDKLTAELNKLESREAGLLKELEFLTDMVGEVGDFFGDEKQKEYWNARLEQEVFLRMLTGGGLDVELTKKVLSMPDGTRVKDDLSRTLEGVKRQMLGAVKK